MVEQAGRALLPSHGSSTRWLCLALTTFDEHVTIGSARRTRLIIIFASAHACRLSLNNTCSTMHSKPVYLLLADTQRRLVLFPNLRSNVDRCGKDDRSMITATEKESQPTLFGFSANDSRSSLQSPHCSVIERIILQADDFPLALWRFRLGLGLGTGRPRSGCLFNIGAWPDKMAEPFPRIGDGCLNTIPAEQVMQGIRPR